MFFNNSLNRNNIGGSLNKTNQPNFEPNKNENQIVTTDIMPDNSFAAYYSAIGSNYVLMQNVRELKVMAQPQLQPYLNRAMPQSNVPPVVSAHNDPTLPQLRGYIAEPNYTTQVRTIATQTAKQVYQQLSNLYALLLNLKTLAPNNSQSQMFSQFATNTYVLYEQLKNVAVQLTNNQNPIMPKGLNFSSMNYCKTLGVAVETINNVIAEMIKLNRTIEIANITPWLNNGLFVLQTILTYLTFENRNC